jgi:hypothetical protein
MTNLLNNCTVALGLEPVELKRLAKKRIKGLASAMRARGKG